MNFLSGWHWTCSNPSREGCVSNSYIFFFKCLIKWNTKIYQTVGTVPKSNRKVVEAGSIDISSTQVHGRSALHGTGTIKSNGVFSLSKMMRLRNKILLEECASQSNFILQWYFSTMKLQIYRDATWKHHYNIWTFVRILWNYCLHEKLIFIEIKWRGYCPKR